MAGARRGSGPRAGLEIELASPRACGTEPSALAGIIGGSAAMAGVRAVIRRVAASDRPVLVRGETGSGKELVVQAIHALGAHAGAPLLDLNCGALPSHLLESQLFGYEKGAFTGADSRRAGYLEAVGEGTLFLDEIGELEPSLQAKLLRVLEARTFRRVGAVTEQPFRGRVIAATHVDLAEALRAGRFREDLYYRLDVLSVRVPSLDERREDVPALVAHFAARQPRRLGFDDGALAALRTAPWPGNVRQLRNTIDRIAVSCESELVRAGDVHAALQLQDGAPADPLRQLVRSVLACPGGDKLELVGRTLVEEALRIAQANKTAAARLLGVHRKVVERWVVRSGDGA